MVQTDPYRIHLYRVQGFLIFDYINQFPTARQQLSRWLSEGKIQRKETIVRGGLKVAEQALADLYGGFNAGKLIVEVRPESK